MHVLVFHACNNEGHRRSDHYVRLLRELLVKLIDVFNQVHCQARRFHSHLLKRRPDGTQ